MKLLLNLLLVLPTAFAQSPRVQILMAPRYAELPIEELQGLIKQLSELRSPGAFEIATIKPYRPILGAKKSLLAEVRRRVLATPVEQKLNLHVVIKSHGSPTAIHSEKCEPIPYEDFASAWRALMAEFVSKGYRPDNLSFDLIFHFCFSGNLRDLMGPSLPFDTLIINSAQKDNTAIAPVVSNMLKRAIPAYVAATKLTTGFFENFGEQELFYLLLNHIYRIDLDTGRGDDNEKLPAPEIEWWPASTRDKQTNLSNLAKHLFELYALALHDPRTHKKFTNTLRYTLNEYYREPLSKAVRLRRKTLSPVNRTLLDHLYFHNRVDRGMSPVQLTRHFNRMLRFPSQSIRDAATHDLLMLGDMVEDADELLAKLADLELAQATLDVARLQLHLEYLREYETPMAKAACQRLMEVVGLSDHPMQTEIYHFFSIGD